MYKLTVKILIGSTIATMAFLPLASFADETSETPPTISGTWYDVLKRVFNILLAIFLVVASFFILYGAYLYLTGDAEKGKSQLLNALIALVIALLAWGIPNVVSLLTRQITGSSGGDSGERRGDFPAPNPFRRPA